MRVTLAWSTDLSPAAWLLETGVPWSRLVGLGPAGFAAYARLRFVPDPVRPGQSEADHDLPDDHPSDLDQARRGLAVLAGFTSTPDDCWFAVWEGYPGSVEIPAGLPLLDVTDEEHGFPVRRYGLLRGRLADLEDWERDVATACSCRPPSPGPPTTGGASPPTSTRTTRASVRARTRCVRCSRPGPRRGADGSRGPQPHF